MTRTITLFEFQDRGACRGHDPELFFPLAEAGPVGERQVAQAKAVCHECPVLEQCRTFALVNSVDGVWGGMSEAERRALRAQNSATAAADEDGELGSTEDPGENDQQGPAPVLPSYTSARLSLTRARRALDLAEQADDPDAVAHAEQRLARARQQFDAVRAQTTSGAVA